MFSQGSGVDRRLRVCVSKIVSPREQKNLSGGS